VRSVHGTDFSARYPYLQNSSRYVQEHPVWGADKNAGEPFLKTPPAEARVRPEAVTRGQKKVRLSFLIQFVKTELVDGIDERFLGLLDPALIIR